MVYIILDILEEIVYNRSSMWFIYISKQFLKLDNLVTAKKGREKMGTKNWSMKEVNGERILTHSANSKELNEQMVKILEEKMGYVRKHSHGKAIKLIAAKHLRKGEIHFPSLGNEYSNSVEVLIGVR